MGLTAAALVGHQFMRGMRADHLERLAATARYTDFPAGYRLLEEGRRADRCYLIQAGQAAIDMNVPGRGNELVETIGRGGVLGWSWLFPPYEWRFGAVALSPVRAIVLDGPALRGLCDADPELGYELHRRFMGVILDRLQNTRKRLVALHTAAPDRSHL